MRLCSVVIALSLVALPGLSQGSASTVAAKRRAGHSSPMKSVPLVPLNPHERVLQLLDRFTFGPRPGEVERVETMGTESWFAQQLNPGSIPDDATNKRLEDYPSLGMTPAIAVMNFPDRRLVGDVADGKVAYPQDPLLASVYQVQVYRYGLEQAKKAEVGTPGVPVKAADVATVAADGRQQGAAPVVPVSLAGAVVARVQPGPGEPMAAGTQVADAQQQKAAADQKVIVDQKAGDAQKAAERVAGQAVATRVAGQLFALPKRDRMAALIKMSVADRAAFTRFVAGDQKNLLLAEFNPREREAFYGMAAGVNGSGQIGSELAQARLVRDVLTERQVQEVMTDFWFNHFNVFAEKDSDRWYTTSYERDVIRRNALGKFRDLLVATAMSPAMEVYLDNWQSIGPDSVANGVKPGAINVKKGYKGLNENYGREVMELHTVGVNGGYTQADVTALAAIFTGWTVDKPQVGGGFQYDPKRHEPGAKIWFGYRIEADGTAVKLGTGKVIPMSPEVQKMNVDPGMKQGLTALALLAAMPQTAHFICWEMAQRFVADDPPAALVDRMTKTYLETDGDIKAVLTTLVASPEFNSRRYFHNKVKTPVEFVVSAFRTTGTDVGNAGSLVNTLKTMGMPLYGALPPTGYYDTAEQWMNSTALVDRLNFAYQLTTGKVGGQKFDSAKVLALGLMARPASSLDKTDGVGTVLGVLEGTMIGVPVSAETDTLIRRQVADPAVGVKAGSAEELDVLTALVMGAPEFQMH